MKAIAERYLDEGENSGDREWSHPFFRHFQILRVHCDLIRFPCCSRDGWSNKDFFLNFSRGHTPLREVTVWENYKEKLFDSSRNLYKIDTGLWLCQTIYLFDTKYFIRLVSDFRNIFFNQCRAKNLWVQRYHYISNDWIKYIKYIKYNYIIFRYLNSNCKNYKYYNFFFIVYCIVLLQYNKW